MFLSQVALVLAALIAAQQPEVPADAAKPSSGEITKDQAEALRSTCGSRRFETTADVTANGKMRRTKITLCAADSDTSADWISKLEKAAAQIKAHPTFPDATKEKLQEELRAEIARVKTAQAFGVDASTKPFANATPTPPVSPPSEPITTSPRLQPKSPLADFNALPPLPTAPAVADASTKAAVPSRRGPQLSVQCALLGIDRVYRCGVLATDERLVIRATEPFNGAVTLRFTRTDSDKIAEVPFASQSLRAGQTARVGVPKAICKGRIRAEFELEAVTPAINGGRSGERLGSFEARCGD